MHRRVWFFVDDEGILRTSIDPPDGRYARHRRRRPLTPYLSPRARAFVGDRRIGLRGARAYWLIPTRSLPPEPPWRAYAEWAEWRLAVEAIPRRQGRELTRQERARYAMLDAAERLAMTVVL